MARELYILDEDKAWAKQRIRELDKAIQELGPEFYEVFNQSSETWHDNAPFDALRDRQSVLFAEVSNLKAIIRDSLPSVPKPRKDTVGIGTIVTLEHNGTNKHLLIAGDWTYRSGTRDGNTTVVSRQSPIGQAVIRKKCGSQTAYGTIVALDNNKEHIYNEA